MRAQFLVEIESRGELSDLAELNRLFEAWVEVVYHRQVHSETKATPIERFLDGGPPALPSPAELHEAFLWSVSMAIGFSPVEVISRRVVRDHLLSDGFTDCLRSNYRQFSLDVLNSTPTDRSILGESVDERPYGSDERLRTRQVVQYAR